MSLGHTLVGPAGLQSIAQDLLWCTELDTCCTPNLDPTQVAQVLSRLSLRRLHLSCFLCKTCTSSRVIIPLESVLSNSQHSLEQLEMNEYPEHVPRDFFEGLCNAVSRSLHTISMQRSTLTASQWETLIHSTRVLRSLDVAAAVDAAAVLIPMAQGATPQLKRLIIKWVPGVTDGDLARAVSQCPVLEVLNAHQHGLADAHGPGIGSLEALAQHCPSLGYLHWGRNIASSAALQMLALRCPKLQHLQLKLGTGLDDLSLLAILKGCPRLAFLNISCCFGVSTDALLSGEACPALRTLVCDRTCLDDCMDHGTMIKLLQRFPNLECLYGPEPLEELLAELHEHGAQHRIQYTLHTNNKCNTKRVWNEQTSSMDEVAVSSGENELAEAPFTCLCCDEEFDR